MPSYVTPLKNTEYIIYVELTSQANPNIFQVNPTLAAGDAKVSIDGGALANLGTLPVVTPAGGKSVKVTLSAAEMNGDNIKVVLSDAAGAEWCDLTLSLQTTARQIDNLAFPTTSGRSLAVTASGEVDLSAAAITAIFARTFTAAYGSYTFDQMVKMMAAVLFGKVSGLPTAPVFRNMADTGNVVSATTDANGNRSAVTLNP